MLKDEKKRWMKCVATVVVIDATRLTNNDDERSWNITVTLLCRFDDVCIIHTEQSGVLQ